MTFWLVKNYRMQPDFILKNWDKMLSRGYFWDAYWLTLGRAALAAIGDQPRRFSGVLRACLQGLGDRAALGGVLSHHPVLHILPRAHAYAWQVILAEQGVINAGPIWARLGSVR